MAEEVTPRKWEILAARLDGLKLAKYTNSSKVQICPLIWN